MASHAALASDTIHSLFARQEGCLDCLNVSPTCPQCKDNEVCQFTSKSCHACPQAYCAIDPDAAKQTSSGGSSSSSSPNTGAIVGGVIGGLAAIAIVTYLVWRFCIKNKRGDYQGEQWQTDPEHSKEGRDDMASRRSARQSTHSVHSLASTVLTRASNIIQIAYIPGVTNRATPTSPTVLVPPVPPIPLAHSEGGSPSPYQEQHFFVPGDLRDSTYSGISGYSDRTSFARSYAPRSSVASTIYGKNAVVSQMPAQKGTLLKPSIISVKSKAGSGDSLTPPVPEVDFGKYDKNDKPPPSPAFSIGSTFFKNASASTATAVRPQVVSVGSSGPKQISIKTKTPTDSIAEEADGPSGSPNAKAAVRESKAVTEIEDTPAVDQGPFSDPPKSPQTPKTPKSPKSPRTKSDLSGLIEEATRRAAESRTNSMASAPRSMTSVPRECTSPFGDQHAVKE
ncbi:hypothetical protein PG996_012473 [Apiospora saccharicola]|uniref:Membrane anchor Opy2 N-terminal domain-containing protein n=1 Tax=Apiospora saccharicola TaxID=335842 RepID=A0ABR1U2N7_9PEZI